MLIKSEKPTQFANSNSVWLRNVTKNRNLSKRAVRLQKRDSFFWSVFLYANLLLHNRVFFKLNKFIAYQKIWMTRKSRTRFNWPSGHHTIIFLSNIYKLLLHDVWMKDKISSYICNWLNADIKFWRAWRKKVTNVLGKIIRTKKKTW